MAHAPHSREQIEEHWRESVKTARLKYEFAVAESRRVLAEQKQWPLPAPDGSGAIRNAILEESAARNEYIRTLKVFTDLTIHGKIPEES
jgi:hypothetical protein